MRRRGTRRYILRILDDGSLRVTVPWWGSKREARAFVESQAAWIARQRVRLAEAAAVDRRWRAGSTVLIDGEPVPLILDASAGAVRLRCGGELVGEVETGADDLKPVVQRWLRRRAVRALPGELQALAAIARGHRRAGVDPQPAVALGFVLAARRHLAQLAAGAGAAVRARVRAGARADAPARAEPLGAVLAARRRGLPALRRGAPLAAPRRRALF